MDKKMEKVVCRVCHHKCSLGQGQLGICGGRINENGKITSKNYGKITTICLDPIEKKPLRKFLPGSQILSVGSFGCNLRCPFCQNYEISMDNGENFQGRTMTPEELVFQALELKSKGNIGIAYTYNEPLIGYEFVKDTAKLAREKGLKNIVVTNGNVCRDIFEEVLPYIDAFNIDLKGFTEEFYDGIKGNINLVKENIKIAAKASHLEITNLIIPGENDSIEEMQALSKWLGEINPEIPLHVARFFPQYKMDDRQATDIELVYELAGHARKNLKYVYEGNC